MLRSVGVVLGLIGTLWAVPVAAQSGDPSGLLAAMRDAYERLDYDTAERRAREALASFDAFSADQLVEVHTALGLILYARNEPLEARTQFEAALSLDPRLTLDPLLVSPKTLEFFDDIRAGLAADGGAIQREPVVRYVRVRDPRPAATVRSLAVPGWGQLYKGERAKGWTLVGLWGATAAGAVTAHVLRSQAEDDYLGATDPAEIADRYDTFNTWHQARSAFVLGAAAVWTYAAVDALVFGGPAERAFTVGPTIGGGEVGLRIRVGL
ncbi:MAG: tetratricopeptide repeat protein [Rhodothermales bacterium]